MKFYIETFGCQMNEHDSLKMAFSLKLAGYEEAKDKESADIIIVNTCCVREKAEQKFYSLMGRIERIKKKKNVVVGVTGCIAQLEKENLRERLPFLDFSLGPGSIGRVVEAINERNKGQHIFDFSENGWESLLNLRADCGKEKVKAYVTIMKGCNNFCSYCIVPYVRGREQSRRSTDVIEEIERLADKGIKEVTLLGQNVNAFNKGKDDISFPELLKRIDLIDGIERIRFVTSHPADLSNELIDLFGSLKKLCEHIHLPFQSGSNRILQLMNRGYKIEEYRKKVELLRRRCKDIAITADCIVGFPGETERDFLETLSLIRDVEFDGLFSFVFSPRRYTMASTLPDRVPRERALERLRTLQSLQKEITLKKNKALEGKIVEVLVEGESKNSKEELAGRTRTNKIVNFSSTKNLWGKLVHVKIKEGYANSLRGELVNK